MQNKKIDDLEAEIAKLKQEIRELEKKIENTENNEVYMQILRREAE